jgi:deoxyadenosine/deoxycytidine kinase
VVIVGHCGAGKSTLAESLRNLGIDAMTAAQEHSIVPDLWRHADPDLLIYLDIDLESVRGRRGGSWSANIFSAQETRLRAARAAADLVIHTGTTSLADAIEQSRRYVDGWRRDAFRPVESTA